jgi:hypothetical protein
LKQQGLNDFKSRLLNRMLAEFAMLNNEAIKANECGEKCFYSDNHST